MSIAGGTAGWAQAPFSCEQALLQGETPDPELRAWIVLIARQTARDFARSLWEKYPELPLPCVDLSCLSDEEIVVSVHKGCAISPAWTLENVIRSLPINGLQTSYKRAREKATQREK